MNKQDSPKKYRCLQVENPNGAQIKAPLTSSFHVFTEGKAGLHPLPCALQIRLASVSTVEDLNRELIISMRFTVLLGFQNLHVHSCMHVCMHALPFSDVALKAQNVGGRPVGQKWRLKGMFLLPPPCDG